MQTPVEEQRVEDTNWKDGRNCVKTDVAKCLDAHWVKRGTKETVLGVLEHFECQLYDLVVKYLEIIPYEMSHYSQAVNNLMTEIQNNGATSTKHPVPNIFHALIWKQITGRVHITHIFTTFMFSGVGCKLQSTKLCVGDNQLQTNCIFLVLYRIHVTTGYMAWHTIPYGTLFGKIMFSDKMAFSFAVFFCGRNFTCLTSLFNDLILYVDILTTDSHLFHFHIIGFTSVSIAILGATIEFFDSLFFLGGEICLVALCSFWPLRKSYFEEPAGSLPTQVHPLTAAHKEEEEALTV